MFSRLSAFLGSLPSNFDSTSIPYIRFVKEGVGNSFRRSARFPREPEARKPLASGILGGSSDWVVMCDGVTESYSIPHHVAITTFRPDIFQVSEQSRTCVLVELTVPFGDRILASADYKSRKYQSLKHEICSNGYRCELFTVEIGCRGNYSASLRTCLLKLGFSKRSASSVCRVAAATALRCSYYIYLKRSSPVWLSM